MRRQIASVSQVNEAVKGLMKETDQKIHLSEETSYYLRLVLNELIINSFQHSGADAAVRVEVGINDTALVISVEDSGRGIANRAALGICADTASETGRGLAIVKGLCTSLELNDRDNRVTARLPLH